MRRLVQGRESVTLVIGEKGSGKTTFLNTYMTSADDVWRKCKIRARAMGTKHRKSPRKSPKKQQAFVCKTGDVPVIIIDDAHQMTQAELKSLFRDAYNPRNGDRSKRIVLFGEPSINAQVTEIAESEGGHFSVNRIHLPRLSEEETSDYLAHRLSIAGYEGKPLFKSSAVKQIFRDSGGLPSDINRSAGKWLTSRDRIKATALRHLPFFSSIRPLWMVLALLCIVVLASVGIVNLRKPDDVKTAGISDTGSDNSPGSQSNLKPEQPHLVRKSLAGHPPVALGKNTPSQPIPIMKVPARSQRERSPARSVKREEWLLNQPSGGYTIQLIGVRSEPSLLAFIESQPLPKKQPLAYYKTVYRGGQWYPLLYGVYPTARQAREAIEGFPDPIREMNPWIRRLSTIQQAIRKHSGIPSSR